jgi:hypothetical protein
MHGRIRQRLTFATVAGLTAGFLAACGGGAAGGGTPHREAAPAGAGTALAQAQRNETSTPRPPAHGNRHVARPARRHPVHTKAAKTAARRPVRAIVRELLGSRRSHSRPAAPGSSLLARILKRRGAPPQRPVTPSKTAPGKDLLSSITSGLQKK